MKFRFPIFIIDEDYRSENASGLGIRALSAAIEAEGVEVIGVTSYGDLSSFAQQQSRASAFILSIDDEEFDVDSPEDVASAIKNLRAFIGELRFRNADIPIYGETRTSEHIPNDILRELHGFIHMFEDTPEFVARHHPRSAQLRGQPAAAVLPRAGEVRAGRLVFLALPRPLRRRGLKSPVGQMFHQFFGENMLRADVCNAVDELGQLLDHTGPVAESELNAARIFHADHCYFVTNGTSKQGGGHANVAAGDVVWWNCHKSILHAITMTGAIPVFLRPTRNHLGIIGPIPLRKKIEANPFAREAVNKNPRILTLTQHLRRRDLQRRNDQGTAGQPRRHAALRSLAAARGVPRVLPGHARDRPGPPAQQGRDGVRHALHAQAAGRHFSRPRRSSCRSPRPASAARTRWCSPRTPRTSCWPAFLQASQIIVQESETRKLDRNVFNEAYLMHTSTSPQYAIIASCDVAAAMMEPPGGTALVEESIREAMDFRRAMRKVESEFGKNDWWFKVWGRTALCPKASAIAMNGFWNPMTTGMASATWPKASTCWTRSRPRSSPRAWTCPAASARPASRPRCDEWIWKSNEHWHGFGDLAEGFNMLDPIKATIITPGLDMSGSFGETGIPAALVSKYLTEHVPDRARRGGRRPACIRSSSCSPSASPGPLEHAADRAAAVQDDYDRNQPLWRILPDFCRCIAATSAWACATSRSTRPTSATWPATTEMYLSDMVPASSRPTPSPAWRTARSSASTSTSWKPRHRRAADAVPAIRC